MLFMARTIEYQTLRVASSSIFYMKIIPKDDDFSSELYMYDVKSLSERSTWTELQISYI